MIKVKKTISCFSGISKIIILIGIILISVGTTSSQSKTSKLKNQIDSLLTSDFFNSTIAAVKVYNLTTSQVLYEKNNKPLLRPASNLKLFTTASALLFLGKNYQFKTSSYYSGKILNKTLYGDVYLKGGLDPFFKVEDLDSMIINLKKLNVGNITGNIYADVSSKDSLFWGKGWMWDDDPDPTAPYLSSLNINENIVEIFTKPQKINQKSNVSFYPESNYYSTETNVVTIKGDSTKIKATRDWVNRKNNITVSGYQYYRDKVDTTEVNIYRPENFFINLFKEKLSKHGIDFKGILDTHSTPKSAIEFSIVNRGLDTVIVKTNKESNNLGAEMILYALAQKFYGNPATAKNGLKLIDSLITLIGDNPENYRVVDGSGVSHYNLISVDLIIELLKYMYHADKELFKLFSNSLPISGVDGTLENRMIAENVKGKVNAKTGTLSGVSNLSGYITSLSGDKLAFSIMIQNFVGSSKQAKNIQDSLCSILSFYK